MFNTDQGSQFTSWEFTQGFRLPVGYGPFSGTWTWTTTPPRSDGGINHISNRLLLCGPCNRAKSNTLTLSGLQRLNQKNGWMAKE